MCLMMTLVMMILVSGLLPELLLEVELTVVLPEGLVACLLCAMWTMVREPVL